MGLCHGIAADLAQHFGQNLAVTNKRIKGIVRHPIIGHLDAKVKTNGFDESGSACQCLGHDHAQHLHDHRVGQFQQPLEQSADAVPRFVAQGNAGFVGVEVQHGKHRAPPLVEAGFGNAGFDALGDRFVTAALILHPHPPQGRTANRMGNHDAQRHAAIRGKR